MGWEQRGSNKYYFRKERKGSRVRSVYLGRGEIAKVTAALDALQREDHKTQRIKQRLDLQASISLSNDLDSIEHLVRVLTDVVLITADFHKHKGQWRKRRL